MKTYYVYIMASRSRTLYTGVTGDLAKRVLEHKRKLLRGFTARYNINRLIYFETFGHVRDAIYREKQIKDWRREKKIELIESMNRDWKDLSMAGMARTRVEWAPDFLRTARDSSLRSE